MSKIRVSTSFRRCFLKAWVWLSNSPINVLRYFVGCAWCSSTSSSSCSQDELSEWLTFIRSTVRSLWVNPRRKNAIQNKTVWSYKGNLGEFLTRRWKSEHLTVKTTIVHACSVASVMFGSLWPRGLLPHQDLLSMGFPKQEYWSGIAISFSRGSSQPRDRAQAFCIAIRFFAIWATRKANITKHLFLPGNRLQSRCGWWQGWSVDAQ